MLKLVIEWIVFQTHVIRVQINARSDKLLLTRSDHLARQNLS